MDIVVASDTHGRTDRLTEVMRRTKCSILPIHIKTKNYRVRLFRKVKVVIGKPIPYEELSFEKGNMAEYNAAAKMIFERICELGKEEQK